MKAIVKSFNAKNKREMDLLLSIAADERNALTTRLAALCARIKAQKEND